MQAFVMQGYGPVSRATLGDLPIPEIRADYLLVRIAAAAVNPTDWKEIGGALVNFYPPYPDRWAPGFDGSGIVHTVGRGVTRFMPGNPVVLLSDRREVMSGSFAEYALVEATHVATAPHSISLAEAASIPCAGITIYQALFHEPMGSAKAGQSVLIHGGAGGLGSFGIGFAKANGLRVAATGRAANAGYLRKLGADLVIDYAEVDIVDATRRWLPGGVDIIVDAVSGGRDMRLLTALKTGGRLVIIATATHDGDLVALEAEAKRHGVSTHFLIMDHATLPADLAAIVRLIDSGKMRMPHIVHYPLTRTGEALSAMQAGGVRGKIVIDILDTG
jgi:NADPH:quinone reductase